MQNLTVHPGDPSPFLLGPAHARPRSRAPVPALSPHLLIGRPCLSAAPPPGTVSRPTRQTSLPSLFLPATRARRMSPTSAALGPLPSVVRQSGPGPTAAPRRVAPPRPDPHLCPPLFPSTALPPSRSLPTRTAPLVLPSPQLSNSSSRAPEPPHRSPHPDHRLRPPAAHCPSWIPTEHRHRPPLPGELLLELPIPAISCNFLTPLPLRCCRPPHPLSPPTRAPSPPTNAAARRHLRRLTVDPSFRCAPALSSLLAPSP
jgi:hypothetical protein